MTDLFLSILKASASATLVALAVLTGRLLLGRAPKWSHVLLWGLVAVRLLLPFSIESELSRMPETVASGTYLEEWAPPPADALPAQPTDAAPVSVAVSSVPSDSLSVSDVLSYIWAAGVGAMGLYTLLSFLYLKRRLRTAVRLQDNLYISEAIDSPFVLGILRPKIYLPSFLENNFLPHVLAHEQAHIRRGDHLWKPLGFLLLSIHWFNPVLWLCYILLCRDIELACDERVVKELDLDARADYSQALLTCAVSHRSIAACPIAFGEVGVKQRVKNVLSYKKPGFWLVLAALILCGILAVSLLTDPVDTTPQMESILNQTGYYIVSQETRTINLVIEKDSLSEESFDAEGCHYSPGVIVPYHTYGDNQLYLSHVCERDGWIEMTFDFVCGEYDKGWILSPWRVELSTGYWAMPARSDDPLDVWDNQTTYPDAARLKQYGNLLSFTVLVRSEVYQQADHHIAFSLTDFTQITYAKGKRPAELAVETEATISTEEFHIFASEVTSVGMTVRNLPDGAWQSINAHTDLNYWLEEKVTEGLWQQLEPASPDGLPISDRTIQATVTADTDEHLLNWSTLYGVLPSGEYRVGIEYYFPDEGITKVLYANFRIDDSMNPANYLSTITAEGRQGFAEFPPDTEQQYVFTTNQTQQLIWILNQLRGEEFFVGAATNLKAAVTLSHPASPIQLYYDGSLVQFSLVHDHTRWAVRDDALNQFMESLLTGSTENGTYDSDGRTPLNELPASYTPEEAIVDQVIVLKEGDVQGNGDIWEAFLLSTNARIPASIRIMKYYAATGSQDAVTSVYDLKFDGNSYYLYYVHNGELRSAHYHNLSRRSEENPLPNEEKYEEYAFYFLTNQDTIDSAKKVRENDRFAKPGDEPFMVWCDHSVRQRTLPIPEDITKITLAVDLQPYITVTEPAILDAIELIFSEAQGCTAPETAHPGPVLWFHSPDGIDLYLMLDLEADLCTFNGQYFYYGKPGHSILEGLWKLLDLSYWPDEIVEHDAFAWYFRNLS